MTPLTPERKAENSAALAAYEAAALSGDIAAIWKTFVVVEQAMNAEELMGQFEESDRIRKSMNRITRERRERRQADRHYAIAAE